MASNLDNKPWKFLHAADLHLDTPMPGRDESMRRTLRAALRTAFERLVELAIEERVEAVLLAGDIIDGDHLSLATEDTIVERCRRLGSHGIRVFIAPGNHDFIRSGSPLDRIRWPENVTVFQSTTPLSVRLDDASGRHLATIHGAGHTNGQIYENLVARISGADEPVPQIGLVHTNVGHADVRGRHEPYAPSELNDFAGKGIDYWAIGHIHQYMELSRSPWVIYPGCAMGRDIGEREAKGCVLVHVHARDDMEPEFRSLAPITFHLLEIDVSEMTQNTQFFDALRIRWQEISQAQRGDEGQYVRIEARGRSELAEVFRHELQDEESLHEFEDRLERTLGVLEVEFRNRTVPPFELESIGEETSVRGEYTRLVREMIREPSERKKIMDRLVWANPNWARISDDEKNIYMREILRLALIEGMERFSGEERG